MAGKKPPIKASKTQKTAKPAKAKAAPRKAAAPPRSKAAVPLRASAPKKVGAVPEASAKPSSRADYLPKTDLPPLHKAPGAGLPQVPNVLAMAQPWMMLGLQMALTGITLQARVARAAMSMAPTPAAFRQGKEAVDAWADAVRGQDPKPRKR
jgi:hypothetical protein